MFGGKPAEILFEMLPAAASRMGLLVNPANPLAGSLVKANSDQLGSRFIVANVRIDSDFEPAFAMLVRLGPLHHYHGISDIRSNVAAPNGRIRASLFDEFVGNGKQGRW